MPLSPFGIPLHILQINFVNQKETEYLQRILHKYQERSVRTRMIWFIMMAANLPHMSYVSQRPES